MNKPRVVGVIRATGKQRGQSLKKLVIVTKLSLYFENVGLNSISNELAAMLFYNFLQEHKKSNVNKYLKKYIKDLKRDRQKEKY